MLRELRVENLAIIKEAILEPGSGFTVLTGETGAGKTLLVQALLLVLGTRATSTLATTGETVRVQAVFDVPPSLEQVRKDFGLDDEVIVVREIAPNGRSRAWIDGRAVPVGALREVGEALLRVHGQQETGILRSANAARELLDRYAGTCELVENTRIRVQASRDAVRELTAFQEQKERIRTEIEILEYEHDEIEMIAPTKEEETTILADATLLRQGVHLEEAVEAAMFALQNEQYGALSSIGDAVARLRGLTGEAVEAVRERLEGGMHELTDILQDLRQLNERIVYDPEAHQRIEDRLSAYETLKRKYGGSVEAVLEHKEMVSERLQRLKGKANETELRQTIEEHCRVLTKMMEELWQARTRAVEQLERTVTESLQELALTGMRFTVERVPLVELPVTIEAINTQGLGSGGEVIDYLLVEGETTRSIRSTASGGELSRVLLAIESALGTADAVPTFIFDEVDVGIGGKTAAKVGEYLDRLAHGHQVICVTHLPQVAARGSVHYVIERTGREASAGTRLRRLNDADRVDEVARMLSGERVTTTSHEHARTLLEGRA